MRGSSVHFKRISSALHAVSHASREVPPEYLLPEGMSLGTHVVIDDYGQLQKQLEHKLHIASRQAKATKDYSPMWEGVINLPDPADSTPKQQIEIVKRWCSAYEKMTGHKVLRADVHLDEGYVDSNGNPQYNAHAHVMCDRTDDKGKVKKLTSTVLREVQNMTAEVTSLTRGLDARTTGRKHINHQNFKFDAEKNRLDLDKENRTTEFYGTLIDKANSDRNIVQKEVKVLEQENKNLGAQIEKMKAEHEAEIAQIQALKDSGEAQKIASDKAIETLKTALKETQAKAAKVPEHEAQMAGEPGRQAAALAAQKLQLDEGYRLEREAMKASGTAKQADYQNLKKAHEMEVSELKKQLAEALATAGKVPELEAQVGQLGKDYEALHEQVLAIQTQRDSLSQKLAIANEKVDTMTQENTTLKAENAKLEAENARYAAMANNYQAERAAGTPAHLIVPSPASTAPKATKTPVAAAKPKTQPDLPPKPEKSFQERFDASLKACVDWVKEIGGVLKDVDTQRSEHYGSVRKMDELHCVQNIGRNIYAVHQLDKLDKVPALDDPKTDIHYRDGSGIVKGQGIANGRGVGR